PAAARADRYGRGDRRRHPQLRPQAPERRSPRLSRLAMTKRPRIAPPRGQAGAFLLEALVGVLVFAFGILGLVGLQAVAIRNTNDLQYRGEAIQIANAAMGQMWTMDRANLETSFEGDAGTGGDGYTALLE